MFASAGFLSFIEVEISIVFSDSVALHTSFRSLKKGGCVKSKETVQVGTNIEG